MKITLCIKIYSKDNLEGLIYSKNYESSVVPSIGEKIKDSIFDVAKKVVDVTYNFQLSTVSIELESKEMREGALNGHVQEVAALHDWVLVE